MAKPQLSVERLIAEASAFAVSESNHQESELYGITDGKAVGTYLEHKFQSLLTPYNGVFSTSESWNWQVLLTVY